MTRKLALFSLVTFHNKKEIRDKDDMTRGWNGCPALDDGKKWTIFQKRFFPLVL